MSTTLRVASCQFSIEVDIGHNLQAVLSQMAEAAEQGARVAHFPETALSGYAGVDIPETDAIDWDQLHRATESILEEAAKRKLWVLLGSTHRLSGENQPHNSVYVISDEGEVVERYMFISYELYQWGWVMRPIVLVLFAITLWGIFRPIMRDRAARRTAGYGERATIGFR
ncbi:MAG: carbon-nitrogen hydrolase family protein, partial [Bacteroidetes bacterium]|nr:carbon-nitrogen hydrolase family protein [Bacteroidota bacterium]